MKIPAQILMITLLNTLVLQESLINTIFFARQPPI